ncbi:MAG TPA: sigma-70 family RNA polymerase sigma factor, partial [Gemmataceae bacterium]|nr:sigma-70 family RNA polymerase sigma factor [Gemmataceae bacterium]
VTGNVADADDAFQATFLVLVRKARTVRPRLLGPWLYGVAYRTAMKARTTAARRRAREAPLPDDLPGHPAGACDDSGAAVDEALRALPARYQRAIVLCDLEGLSYREAADRLGVPEGTLAGHLSRGRRLLAGRLRRRGVAVPAALVVAVPAALLKSTVSAATGRGVSPAVAALAHGVLTNMLLTNLRPAATVLVLVGALVLTATAYRGQAAPGKPAPDKPAAAKGGDTPKAIDESLADSALFHPRVWLELKLSAEQRDEIDRLLDADETRATELLKSMRQANGANDPRAAAEARERARMQIMKLPTETAVAIQTKVLKLDQARRLRQIALQAKGPGAFLRDDVKAALKYTPEQEKELTQAVDAAWDRIRIGDQETAAEAYTGAMTKLLEGLTKEQQKAWDDLTGKAFPMPDIVVRKMLNQHAVATGGLPGVPGIPGGFAPAPPPAGAFPPRAAPPKQ